MEDSVKKLAAMHDVNFWGWLLDLDAISKDISYPFILESFIAADLQGVNNHAPIVQKVYFSCHFIS